MENPHVEEANHHFKCVVFLMGNLRKLYRHVKLPEGNGIIHSDFLMENATETVWEVYGKWR